MADRRRDRRRRDPSRPRTGRVAQLLALTAFSAALLATAVSVDRNQGTVSGAAPDGTSATPAQDAAPSTEPGAGDQLRVAVYGDSLVWEARAALATRLEPDVAVRIESFGGTALCDYTDRILADAAGDPSRLVVIGFTGNTHTPCMDRVGDDPTRDELAAAYVDDLDRVIEELDRAGTPVLLVGAPPSLSPEGATRWTPINQAWQDAADRWAGAGADVTYADTGRVLTHPDGRWAGTLPCLPFEDAGLGCGDGRIRVRSDDSVHFCAQLGPAPAGVIQECAVWNSGAWRYAGALADAVRTRLADL